MIHCRYRASCRARSYPHLSAEASPRNPAKRYGCDTGGRYCSRGQGSSFLAPKPLNKHVPGSGGAHYPSSLCLFKQSCIYMVSMMHHRFFSFLFFFRKTLKIAPRIGSNTSYVIAVRSKIERGAFYFNKTQLLISSCSSNSLLSH